MTKRGHLGLGLLLSAMAVAIAEQGAKTTTSIIPQDQYITYPGPQITQEDDYCETSASNDKPTPEEQSYLDNLYKILTDALNNFQKTAQHWLNAEKKMNNIKGELENTVAKRDEMKNMAAKYDYIDTKYLITPENLEFLLYNTDVNFYEYWHNSDFLKIGYTSKISGDKNNGIIMPISTWRLLDDYYQTRRDKYSESRKYDKFKDEADDAQKKYDEASKQVSTAIQARLQLRRIKCFQQEINQEEEKHRKKEEEEQRRWNQAKNQAWGVASQAGLLAALGLGAVGAKKGSNKYRRYTVTQKTKKYQKTRNQRNAERAIQLQQQRNLRIPRH